MNSKQIIVFPRGSLDKATKAELAENGYLGIEADDPKAVVTVVPLVGVGAHIAGDKLVQALIDVCLANDSRHKEFGAAILRSLTPKVKP